MIETRQVEADPLAAIRAELMSAARRRTRRQRTRRRVVLALGALLTLLAMGAGASALSGLGTGVPVIDELIESEPGFLDGRSGPGGATEPLSVPTNDGTAYAVAYLKGKSTICHAEAERHPRIEGAVRGGGGACWRAADLARRLEAKGLVWAGSSHGAERRVYTGYADGEVERVRARGGAGRFEVKLSPPWRPAAPGAQPLRLFVLIDEADVDVGGDGVQLNEVDRPHTPVPALELSYAGGRTITVRAPYASAARHSATRSGRSRKSGPSGRRSR